MTQAAATAELTDAQLVPGTVTPQSSATVSAGKVIAQSPPAGSEVADGSAVNLLVSTGPASVTVPNVVGMTQSAATAALTDAQLVPGTATPQSSATVSAGQVISQSPSAGTSATSGSPVALVVSTGPVSASASISPILLAFGNWMVNGTSPGRSVTITNTGTTVLQISSISLTGNILQFPQSTNCPSQLAVAGTCTATVTFKPLGTGTKSANLTIAFGGGVASKAVALTGTGVNYSFTVSPTTLAFGNVARGSMSAAKNITMKNTSSVALPITSITLAGTNPGQYTQSTTCPAQLSAGGTCTASVRFKPTSAGSKPATLVIAPGNGAAAKSVALSGTGT
jgi:trimeric autotransporter adhesin